MKKYENLHNETFFIKSKGMDVRELLDHVGDRGLYELLKDTEHQTLEILLLSTWGYSGREIAKIMGMAEQTVYTKRNRLRKKLKKLSKIE